MSANVLPALIALPAVAGVTVLLAPRRLRGLREAILLFVTLANLVLTSTLLSKQITYSISWAGGFGFEFALRLYHFSAFILLATAGFAFLISLYSVAFIPPSGLNNQFYSYLLLTVALVNGATLADNLALMLFFWEGTTLTVFGMIIIGHSGAYRTAIKALLIGGVTDLCMMFGIGLAYYLSGTMAISKISLPLNRLGAAAFLFMAIGAVSKAGCMPFHSWIPDASIDAPLPFMAFLPASLEKLLGIYFLARLSLDMFRFSAASWVSVFLMVLGSVTILLAVAMALIQRNYKRLLSYHAISQVGYMILGIGTATPAGIVGGLFHMINHAMYKSCLFLTAGAVERQTGTTDLNKLGGLARRMPVTTICFVVTAASISGVPPFNGFFSKELVYDGALGRHWMFYGAALLGSFLTAASFLKLGHAAYFGHGDTRNTKVKEAPLAMLFPMVTIAAFCVLFGVYNALPLQRLIQPILGVDRMRGHDFSGMPHSPWLVGMTLLCLLGACANHWWGVRRTGAAIRAADHIHDAPILWKIYEMAERGIFDPYNVAIKATTSCSEAAFKIDRALDWVYEVLTVKVTYAFTQQIRKLHNGSYPTYIVWSLFGIAAAIVMAFHSAR